MMKVKMALYSWLGSFALEYYEAFTLLLQPIV